MCDSVLEGGRRCPCDSSEARRLRLHKNKTIKQYTPLLTKPKTEQADTTVDTVETIVDEETINQINAPFSVETIKNKINEVHTLLEQKDKWTAPAAYADTVEWLAKIDEANTEIGLGVEYLAETKYGAPTDQEIKNLYDEHTRLLDEKLGTLPAEIEDLAQQRRILTQELVQADRQRDIKYDALLNEHGLNRFTHPIIREREEKLAELAPKEWAELEKEKTVLLEQTQKIVAVRDQEETLRKQVREIQTAHNENQPYAEAYQKRNTATLEALKELGVEFAKPGDLKYIDTSHKKAIKSVEAVVHHYPKEWVEASNARMDTNPLRLKDSTGRAHYSDNRVQRTRSSKHKGFVVEKPADWKPNPLDKDESCYVPLDENGMYTDQWGNKTDGSGLVTSGMKGYMFLQYEDRKYYGEGEPPARRGYTIHKFPERTWNSAEARWETGEPVYYYRKPVKRTYTNYANSTSELTVSAQDGQSRINKNAKNTRVALHELAHRMEASNPHITQIERAFLLRRAGFMNQNPEKLTPINDRKKEIGYQDDFPNHYMGRVYDGKYYEILSMGMESIFEGTQGGLVGVNNVKADSDYKRAILGILASGAKKFENKN